MSLSVESAGLASARARVVPALAALMSSWLAACASSGPRDATEPGPSWRPVRVTHHVGGAYSCVASAADTWYIAQGAWLLVIDGSSHETVASVALTEAGEGGRVVDLLVEGSRLFAALDETDVVQVDISQRRAPRVAARASAAELGVRPRVLSCVGNDVFVSGHGGVVRWRDRKRMLECEGEAGRVVQTGDRMVASIGRRAVALEKGEYLGAASDLQPWRAVGGRSEALVFELRGEAGSTVGLMSHAIREIDRVSVGAAVRRVRAFSDHLWVVTDSGVTGYSVEASRLVEGASFEIAGALDVAAVDRNHVVVVGSFGRATVWIERELDGPGWLVNWINRAPTGLSSGWSDGRFVAATDGIGVWVYSTSDGALQSRPPGDIAWQASPQHAAAVWGRAEIDPGGRSITVNGHTGRTTWSEPVDVPILCAAAVDARLWLGTGSGISILAVAGEAAPTVTELQSIRIEGGVSFIFPLLAGNGAAYVTREGGFGVVSR